MKLGLGLHRGLALRLDYLLLGLLALLLAACGGDEGDDLDQYMQDATKNIKPKVQPLPEVKPYVALIYNEDGTLSDPFRARKVTSKSGNLQPDLKRPKEPMESYPLESVKYVGMISKNKLTFALLKAPDNSLQQVKVGNYVGQNFGRVTAIADNELTLVEIVQDELSGDWVDRTSTLALQE